MSKDKGLTPSPRTYRLHYTTNLLTQADWSTVAGPVTATGGITRLDLPGLFDSVSYRLEVLPP